MRGMKQKIEAKTVFDLLADLKVCTMKRDLQWGRRIHAKGLDVGNDMNTHVLTALIKMYAKCGSIVDARGLFDTIHQPDVVSWTSLIFGYAEKGDGFAAMELYLKMKVTKCAPNSVTYVAALKACICLVVNGVSKPDCLEQGRQIHFEIGGHLTQYVQSTLIEMYAKCGCMVYARQVFDSIENPDVVSWTALLLGYADNGAALEALDLFSKMKDRGCTPNYITCLAALKACTSLAENGNANCLERGRKIHSEIGCMNLYVQNMLIQMYAKCSSMVDARAVFDSITDPDVVSWNTLLLGYADNGEGLIALHLFHRVTAPNSITYVAALKACISLAVDGTHVDCLELGRDIHSRIGCRLNMYVQSTLIDMYAKCGSMVDAHKVFDSIQMPNVVCWTALLLGYAENGEGRVALNLFSRMKARACAPDSLTYVAVLKAYTSLMLSGECSGKYCKDIRNEIGCNRDHYVQSALIDMYFKCGMVADARVAFDGFWKPNVVTWNVLLLGYAENGEGLKTLELFSRMNCAPDSLTYIAALKACCLTGALAFGRKLHLQITEFTARVVTCLVDFYAKCGSMVEAHEVFDLHPKGREVPTWNALLAGYGSSDCDSMFNLFEAMQDGGFRPNGVTFLCILLWCSHAGLVEKAREYFKAMSVQHGVTPTVMHYNCMVDVLSRANRLTEAISVIQGMPCTPNAVTWRTLLGACRKWKNAEIGRLALESMTDMNKADASDYVIMANMCGTIATEPNPFDLNARPYIALSSSKCTPTVVA